MSAPASPTSERSAHGPGARVMLVVLGLLFSLMGVTLALATAWVLMDKRGAAAALLVFLGLCLFLTIAGYGVVLLRRGLRGWSRVGRLDRAAPRFERALEDLGPLPGLMLGVAVWIWTRGQVSAPELLWYFAVSFVFFPIGAAVHEVGHLLPGLIQGRILSAIRIWPVTLERSASGDLQRSAGLRTTDGLLGFVSWSSLGPDLGRAADVVMLASGPLANLAFA